MDTFGADARFFLGVTLWLVCGPVKSVEGLKKDPRPPMNGLFSGSVDIPMSNEKMQMIPGIPSRGFLSIAPYSMHNVRLQACTLLKSTRRRGFSGLDVKLFARAFLRRCNITPN